MPGKKNGRVRRMLLRRMADAQQGGQPTSKGDKVPEPEKPVPSDSVCQPSGSELSRTQLLTGQAVPQSDSSSTPSPPSVSTSVETLSLSSEEEMPLRLPRLRLRKSKESLSEKAPDATSVVSMASLTSTDSWTQQAPENGGYSVSKLKDLSKLHKAVWKDDLGKVKAALASLKKSMYVDYFDKENRTALHFACARGHVDIVKAICDAGADPNISDNQGATSLHKLMESGCSGGVVYVLANGADPNASDHLGRTPLHLAAKMGDLSSVTQLIAKDARLDVIEKCGLTPLHIATLNGHEEVSSVFIQEGANVDYRDSMGRTALMMASLEGRHGLVRLLLEGGANAHLLDKDGLRALDLARSGIHHDCAKLLEKSPQKVKGQSEPTSFLDQPLLSSVYAPPADTGGPAANWSTNESVSEDLSAVRPGDEDSWGGSDTEDDLLTPHKPRAVNLKAAFGRKPPETSPESEPVVAPASTESKPLDLAAEGSKDEITPPLSEDPARYKLSTVEDSLPVNEDAPPLANEGVVPVGDKDAPPPTNEGALPLADEDAPPLTDEGGELTSDWDTDDATSPFELPDDSPMKLPSVLTISKPPQTTPLKEITPPPIADTQLELGGISRDSSLEGLLTVDEEISDSESCGDMDHVELVEGSGYVPSTPDKSLNRSDVLKRRGSSGVKSEAGDSVDGEAGDGVRAETPDRTDTFVVSPLSSGHFTSDFLSPDNSGPSRPVTGRSRQPLSSVDNDEELLEMVESEDDVERLLEEANHLETAHHKPTPPEDEYQEFDWDDEEVEETEDESEDEEPRVSALMSMSGASLHDPILSPPRSPRRAASVEKLEEQERVEATPPPADEVTPPVESESEESEVNFDSDEDELDDLLPPDHKQGTPLTQPTPVSKEVTPPTPLAPAARDSPSPLHSPTLSPLHTTTSLRNLPPLTIERRLSPLRLAPLSSTKLGPIAADLGPSKLAPIANDQGHTPKLSDQSSCSVESETESEWEREKNEKKRLASSQHMDSGLDTMTTVTSDPPPTNPLDESRCGTSVDSPTVDQHGSTCVDPQLSTSVDQQASEPRPPPPQSDTESTQPLTPPISRPIGRLAPISGHGSFTSEDSPKVQAYKSLWRGLSTSSPTLPKEIPAISTADEATPHMDPTPPPAGDPPTTEEEEVPVVTPGNEVIPAEPSEESILEMLSEGSEAGDGVEDVEELVADFSGSALPQLDTASQLAAKDDEPEVEAAKEEPEVKIVKKESAVIQTEPPSIAEPLSLQMEPITTSSPPLSRENSGQWVESIPISMVTSVETLPTATSLQALSKETSTHSVMSSSFTGTMATKATPSRELLPPLPEHRSVEVFSTSPTSFSSPRMSHTPLTSPAPLAHSSPHVSPASFTSHAPTADPFTALSEEEVRKKPKKLVVASLAGTSSGDIKQEVTLMEDTPPRIATMPRTKSPLNLTKMAPPTHTSAAGVKGGSVSDSRLEMKRSGPLSDDGRLSKDVLLEDELIDSEESEMSVAGLSRHGFHQDTTLTPSQLHASTGAHLTVESGDDLPQDLSLSDLSGPLDYQASHDLLSQSSKMSDDPPFSHYLRLNQSLRSSQMGEASLLSSAHTAQLQEGLRGATQDLERSQNEAQASQRMRKHLESQLDEFQKKYNSTLCSKISLEDMKLDLELQVRELKYQLDQSREGMKSSEGICSQLKEQLDRMELKLSREVESRQAAELKCREVELAHRSLTISHQTLQDELSEVSSRLQGERESKILQEGLHKEQGRLYETLRTESTRTQDMKTELIGKLELSDKARQELQTQVSELTKTNTQLHSQLTGERRRAEEVEGQLEMVRGQVRDQAQGQAQFEAHLGEFREKAEFLSTALDQEASQRSEAQEEVRSLKAQLDTVTSELDSVHKLSRDREGVLTQQVEELKQEKNLREKDLEVTRNLHSQQSSKTEALESKLQESEKELKAANSLLFERANQIAALQRDVDHKGSRVSALEESLQLEHERQSKLEAQLGVANEKLTSLQSEGVALRQQVEFAQRRVEEKERSGMQSQQRFDDLLGTLRTEYDKSKANLEERCHSLVETQTSLREEVVRREEKMATTEREKEELKKEISRLTSTQTELLERLERTEEAYSELEAEKNEILRLSEQLEAKVGELVKELTARTNQTSLLEEKVTGLQTSLSEAHQTTRVALDEKQATADQKAAVESDLQETYKQVSSLEALMEAQHKKEEGLEKQMAHLQEVRSTLQTHLSETQAELSQTKAELDLVTSSRDKALAEAEEARGLWENEVRSKSKLGVKLMEMEKSQVDTSGLVDAEKRRTRKALEMKKGAEWKLEALQKQHNKLTSDMATARTQLKQSKRRIQELELSQSQVPGLRAGYEREVTGMQRELEGLKQLVSASQDRHKREVEKRHRAEQATSRVRQELEEARTQLTLGQSDSQSKRKEVLKLERTNRKLREELAALQEHVATHMVSRSELEAHKKNTEEKAHRELSRKLEEVNRHLEQQAQAQEALARLRVDAETDQRDKFDRSTTEMRLQLGQCESDKQTAVSEAKRYKELYESELLKSSNLSSLLQRAKEDSEDYQNRLSLERNRTHQLMNATQTAALGSLTPPRPTRYTESLPHTSTPHRLTPSPDNMDLSPTDSLLSTVRTKLDQSIARHKDRVPTTRNSIGTATRSTYSPHKTSLDSLPKQSHLDAIRRNYRI